MKINTLLLVGIGLISTSLKAQNFTEKVVDMKAGYADQVYYSMENGEVGRSAHNNWDISFTSSIRDNGVHANHINGVEVYAYTKGDTGAWSSFDTSGWASFPKFYNSTSNLLEGAFNQSVDPNNPWDFSWGVYNVNTHTVVGDSLYLLVFRDQSQQITDMKKFWLVKQTSAKGNLTIRFANVDGTDDHTEELENLGADYNNTYYNIRTKKTVSREPMSGSWDITFTRWMQFLGPQSPIPYYPVMGVHSNHNTFVSKTLGMDPMDVVYWRDRENAKREAFLIGSDWKYNDRTTHMTHLVDSLTYVVYPDSLSTMGYPFYFSEYEGTTTGIIKINVGTVNLSASSLEVNNTVIYPNPVVNGYVTIEMESIGEGATLEIANFSGAIVDRKILSDNQVKLNVENYKNGIYFVKITSKNSIQAGKFIVNQ